MLYDKSWDRISSEKTLLSQIKAESEQISIQKGEQIGMRKIALNAKKKGMSIKDISELTGLSEKEILKLLI